MRTTTLILILATALAGCATTPVATVEPVCGGLRTVWVAKDDVLTERTASQIEANNLARVRLCGRSRPPPPEKDETPPMKPPAAAFKKVPTS